MSIHNSSLYLKGFTSQLTEFVTDLLLIYEDNQKLITCQRNIDLLVKNNPKMLILNWKKYITKYSKEIEEGDIEFFMNKDYKSDVGNKGSEYLVFIDEVKKIMTTMSEDNKNKVIKYIKNLNKLASLYN